MTPKEAVLKAAHEAYDKWLDAHPMKHLFVESHGFAREAFVAAFAETLEGEPEGLLRSLSLRCGYIISGYGDAKLEAKEMLRLITAAMPPTPKERPEGKLLVAAPSREGKEG